MSIEFNEVVINFLNELASYYWLFLLIGIIHILIKESSTIYNAKEKKDYIPVLRRSIYLVVGTVMLFFSYTIVSFFGNMFTVPDALLSENTFFLKKYVIYTGLVLLTGFVLSAVSLILSAGDRWLVNLSKLFITVSILYLMVMVIVANV